MSASTAQDNAETANHEVLEISADHPEESRDLHDAIPVLQAPSYEEFFQRFMRTNKPCILSGVSRDWTCTARWVRDGTIDHEYLSVQYGDALVPITDCEDVECKAEQSTLREYLTYLKDRSKKGDVLYLRNWHLRRERPLDPFYVVPSFFASDWLNEYSLDTNTDDFMFVYIGPKDSWTGLHADVYSSFSWSVNVVGRKRWILLPPGEESKLRNERGALPRDLTCIPDETKYYEVIQEAGDAIFVPSDWFHVVYNQLDTISINHNWVNGCNIMNIWRSLRMALSRVERELDDIRGAESFAEDCQNVLRSDHGMNYEQFFMFFIHIGRKRLRQVKGEESAIVWDKYRLGRLHILYDLQTILSVVENVLSDDHTTSVLRKNLHQELMLLKTNISAVS